MLLKSYIWTSGSIFNGVISVQAMATWLTSFSSIGYYSPVLHDLVADNLVRIMDRTNLQVTLLAVPVQK